VRADLERHAARMRARNQKVTALTLTSNTKRKPAAQSERRRAYLREVGRKERYLQSDAVRVS
jgi:hypothetical protein